MDPLLVYVASDLDTAGIPVDRDLPPEWLIEHLADVDVHAERPGHIEGRLSRSGTDNVVVRCDVRAAVNVPCARCLRPAPVELRGELSLLLRPGKVLPAPARAVREGEAGGSGKPKAGGAKTNGDGKKKADAGPGTQAVEAVKALRTSRGAAGTRAPRREVAGATGRGAHAGRSAEARPDRRGERGGLPEYEFSSEEADHDLYDGETVILDEFVREALLLEMPNFPLCSEDCPGIGPVPADVGSSPDEASSAPSPSGTPTGVSTGGGEGADAARPPGTKSLGDVLRAALADRAKTPAAKKR